MLPSEFFSRIDQLTNRDQAICVYEAAVQVIYLWDAYEKSQWHSQTGRELIQTFERWVNNEAVDKHLKMCEENLYDLLPQDLGEQVDPTTGFAGWSIYDVAMIALDECEDVLHSILRTGVIYAAAAKCQSGHDAVFRDVDQLTTQESEFIYNWWKKCVKRFPTLNPQN